jgi:SAM-dependent methyltransferase
LTHAEARALIAHPSLGLGGPQTWADLGCGRGRFTLALASLLPDGSTIHAVDTDRSALEALSGEHRGVRIVTHAADFTAGPWPFDGLHGVLMANALHYVSDPAAFLERLVAAMDEPRLLLVEYDTDVPNAWVPHPLSRTSAPATLAAAGLTTIVDLGKRPSRYRRGGIYAALVTAARDRPTSPLSPTRAAGRRPSERSSG